jgi:hypothetical protein
MSYAVRFGPELGSSVRRVAREQLEAAAAKLEDGYARDPVEAVHDARKALKKERSLLRLARGSMKRSTRRRENAAFREAGRRLSAARDADVIVQALDDLASQYAGQVPQKTFAEIRGHLAAAGQGQRESLMDSGLTGEVAEALRRATTIDPATAAEPLDAYVNSYYRSAKNARLGLELAALLDAQESVSQFLQFAFAVHGRVRPYNKWLEWELAAHPLPVPIDLALLRRIATTADLRAQQELFREAERIARDRGHGRVVDGWEPDVAWLRGGLQPGCNPVATRLQG